MVDFKVFYHYFFGGTEGYHKNETELTAERCVWKLNSAVRIRGRELNMFAKAKIYKKKSVIR